MSMSKSRLTTAVGSLALLVLVLLSWFLVLSPQMSKATEIKEQTEAVTAANATLTVQIAKVRAQEANLDAERAVARALAARFPATAAQSEMFVQVRQAAGKAGIADTNVTALTPSVPQGGAGTVGGGKITVGAPGAPKGVASLQVGLTVSGTYTQMTKFLATLETMPRAYLIDTLALAPAGDSNRAYTLTITGTMFALQAPVDPADAARAGAVPTAGANPGAPPGTAPGSATDQTPASGTATSTPNVADPGVAPATP